MFPATLMFEQEKIAINIIFLIQVSIKSSADGNTKSSLSTNNIHSPLALSIPKLRAELTPPFFYEKLVLVHLGEHTHRISFQIYLYYHHQ